MWTYGKKMEASKTECFTIAWLFCCILKGEWIKEPCRTLGSHEVLNLQRYVMLHRKESISGCLLSVSHVLCLPCPGFIGPSSETVEVCGTDFQEFQTIDSHLGTFQELHFYLMDKFHFGSGVSFVCSSLKTFWSEILAGRQAVLYKLILTVKLYLGSFAQFFSRASFSFLQKHRLRRLIYRVVWWKREFWTSISSCTLDLNLSSSKGWWNVCHYLIEYVKCLLCTCKILLFQKKSFLHCLQENCSDFMVNSILLGCFESFSFIISTVSSD